MQAYFIVVEIIYLLFSSVDCECDVPSISVELKKTVENATVIYTNTRFRLRATFQDNCDKSRGYQLYWEVCKCGESTGLCNQMIPYGKNKPGRTKYLFPRLFGVGYMYIRGVVKNHIYEVITYDHGYVRIILPPLVAQIKGPSSVRRGNESVIILDGSESYDPEVKYKKAIGLFFSWYCRREVMSHDDKDELPTVSQNGVGVCYGTERQHLNNSLPTLYLDVGSLRGNNTYVFEVLVQKGDRSTRKTHKLRVEDPFELFVR